MNDKTNSEKPSTKDSPGAVSAVKIIELLTEIVTSAEQQGNDLTMLSREHHYGEMKFKIPVGKEKFMEIELTAAIVDGEAE